MILLKGEFDLQCEADEAGIRSELMNVFLKRFSLIREKHFDFVKRDRNSICTPVVKEGHTWDYAHVKHLCGAGKLYVRLNVSKEIIMENDTDSAEEQPPLIDLSLPSTSQGASSVDARISSLSPLFPNASLHDISYAAMHCDDLNLAANYLSEKYAPELDSNENDDSNNGKGIQVAEILQKLKLKMKPYCTAEKIKVDREDVVIDVFQHYKNPSFDPTVPVKFKVRGEPAIDTGGVLRQVFEDVFMEILKGGGGLQMFQGPPERVIPTYRSSTILTGSFEIFGKMIGHSLIQGGPGFPHLCPTLYWYIATGDLQQGLARASCIDILDPLLAEYVRKIRDATPSTLLSIRSEEDFLQILQNSGETRLLQQNNKLDIVQSLLMHDVILKHKAALDQLRKGLSILGLLNEMEKSPEKFQHFFVHKDNDINAEFVKSLLRLADESIPPVKNVFEMLLEFIDKAKKEVLCNFLCFVTGCKSSTAALKPGCVHVSVEDVPDIFASTCILELKLPLHFSSSEQFEACIYAVIDSNTFTTV